MRATRRGTLPRLRQATGTCGSCRARASVQARRYRPPCDLTCPGSSPNLIPISVGHSIQRAPVDAEHIRRPRPIASDRLKHVLDVAALHLLERREIFEEAGGDVATDALQQGWEILGSHDRAPAEQDDAFDGVFELPNVAGPVVRQQHIEGAGRELDLSTDALARSLQKCGDEERDVVPPFPECRQTDDDHAEAIVQVGPKLLLSDRSLQIAVGGRDDAIVDLDRAAASDWSNLAFLQDPQQLDLEGRRGFPDLVEEDGPALGLLEDPLGVGDGAGEGAATCGRTAPTRAAFL